MAKKKKTDWPNLLQDYAWSIGLGLIGFAVLFYGLYHFLVPQEQASVEIIPTDREEVSGNIWVDLEGAVEKPGVYELLESARINDLLIRAGGLAAEADRAWVEKNINLAQKLADGVKIYIPREGEASLSATGSVAGTSVSSKININSATAAELDTLWGIGQSRAASIMAGRPYQSTEELESKGIIPENVYERIKDEISVY